MKIKCLRSKNTKIVIFASSFYENFEEFLEEAKSYIGIPQKTDIRTLGLEITEDEIYSKDELKVEIIKELGERVLDKSDY